MENTLLYLLIFMLIGVVAYLIKNPRTVYRDVEINNGRCRTPDERMLRLASGKLNKKINFMTTSEKYFWNQFKIMLVKEKIKGVHIFPEVCFLALLDRMAYDSREAKFAVADLRPDFALWSEERNQIVLLIEIDGNGHSSKNDRVKEEACKMLGIQLVRLSETDIKLGYEESEPFREIYLTAKMQCRNLNP